MPAGAVVVIATGSTAALPRSPGPPRRLRGPTARRRREGRTGRLLVLGGAWSGVELAQAYATLGASVAVVEALPRLIAREEEFASEEVRNGLRARGVDVPAGGEGGRGVARRPAGAPRARGPASRSPATNCWSAWAAGPTPGAGLTVGLEPGKNVCRRPAAAGGCDWLYAIGDVNGRALLPTRQVQAAWRRT